MASQYYPQSGMIKEPDVEEIALEPVVRAEELPGSTSTSINATAAAPGKLTKGEKIVNWMDRYWVWEAIGVIGSALCIMGICIFLKAFDHHQMPSWAITTEGVTIRGHQVPHVKIAVSFNSVVGWFSTIGKILLLIPVVKGLGQLKWVWFTEGERDLTDFETFDAATRGLTGSAMLVWKFKGMNFAALGALAMIMSLAYDPLIQNLVTYPNVYDAYNYSSPYGGAYIAWTNTFDVVDERIDPEIGALDVTSKQMILDSVYDTGLDQVTNSPYQTPQFSCTTANCTWPLIPILTAWAQCEDLSSQLIKNCTYDPARDASSSNPGCDISLPNGFKLGGAENMRNRVAAVNTTQRSGLQPMVYGNYSESNTYFTILHSIAVNQTEEPYVLHINAQTSVVASECVIVPALITANSSVGRDSFAEYSRLDSGQWSETTQDLLLDASREQNDSIVLIPPKTAAWGGGSSNFSQFTISNRSVTAYRNYLNWILPAYVDSKSNSKYPRFVSDNGNNGVPEAIFGNPWSCDIEGRSFDDTMACNVQYISVAMSTTLRNAPYLAWLNRTMSLYDQLSDEAMALNATNSSALAEFYNKWDNNAATDPVKQGVAMDGVVYLPTTNLVVTWYWIILPIVLWVMSTVFILGVLWRTRRSSAQTWRTNPLAPLFLDLGREEREHVSHHKLTEHGLASKAKDLKVRLRFQDSEAKLVGPGR